MGYYVIACVVSVAMDGATKRHFTVQDRLFVNRKWIQDLLNGGMYL